MKGFKAFGKGLVCRGKQYAENTVFEEKEAEICGSGMHFCENPLDVLNYYPLVDENCDIVEVAEVEALDKCKTDGNKKFCTNKLKIGVKLSLERFVKAAIAFASKKNDSKVSIGGGLRLASADRNANLVSAGDDAKLASSGIYARLVSAGELSCLASSSYGVRLVSEGDGAMLASSGYGAMLVSEGDYVKIASAGYDAMLVSEGNYVRLASAGYGARLVSAGNCVKIASAGDDAKLASSGVAAVIAGIGRCNTAKGKKGSWLVLAEWEFDDIEGKLIPIYVKATQIDGEVIKEDTFYKLENGEFKEV